MEDGLEPGESRGSETCKQVIAATIPAGDNEVGGCGIGKEASEVGGIFERQSARTG